MMLHAAAAMKCGHRRILIRTVDTDVVVLPVWIAQECHELIDELWLAFGTGKNIRYIAAHELLACLGPEKSKSLPVFHAITGCDTVSAFAGCGKTIAWAVRNTFPEVTDAFLCLASAPKEISAHTTSTIETHLLCYCMTERVHAPMSIRKEKGFLRRKDDQLREYLQHWQLLNSM